MTEYMPAIQTFATLGGFGLLAWVIRRQITSTEARLTTTVEKLSTKLECADKRHGECREGLLGKIAETERSCEMKLDNRIIPLWQRVEEHTESISFLKGVRNGVKA